MIWSSKRNKKAQSVQLREKVGQHRFIAGAICIHYCVIYARSNEKYAFWCAIEAKTKKKSEKKSTVDCGLSI